MDRKWIIAIVVIAALTTFGSYNYLVSADETVSGAWGEVKNQLKRRNDLIPNLVNTVQGYAAHEQGVFKEVTEARAKVGQAIIIDASKLGSDPALQQQLLNAQQSLNASLGRLIAVAENYPVLKANENFLRLQDELAGTENRISVARGRANDATKDYNKAIRVFPVIIVARLGGFTSKQYLDIPEDEQKVPKVSVGPRA